MAAQYGQQQQQQQQGMSGFSQQGQPPYFSPAQQQQQPPATPTQPPYMQPRPPPQQVRGTTTPTMPCPEEQQGSLFSSIRFYRSPQEDPSVGVKWLSVLCPTSSSVCLQGTGWRMARSSGLLIMINHCHFLFIKETVRWGGGASKQASQPALDFFI